MKRWLLWLFVGVVIHVVATAAYMPQSPMSDSARFFATLTVRGYVYVTLIALAIGLARWLFRKPSDVTPPA